MNHEAAMKKSKSKIQIQLEQFSPKERKAILKWIDALSEQEIEQFSGGNEIEKSQAILKVYFEKKFELASDNRSKSIKKGK